MIGLALPGRCSPSSATSPTPRSCRSPSDGYTLHATFDNAATLRETAPVRIAGVKVGEVIGVERSGEAAEVTFTVDDEGPPIHEDAEVKIRPRLFLEGNFFLDLRPGSPSAPELPIGRRDPVDADLDRGPARRAPDLAAVRLARDLQELLKGYGTALTYEPTAADDEGQDPDVAGETAADRSTTPSRYGGEAGRDTAIVNEALLGTQPPTSRG